MPKFKITSTFRIDGKNNAIFIKIGRFFNEKKAKKLKNQLAKLKNRYNLFKFIIILPNKLKLTQKAKGLLLDFIKENNFIVASSPIQRAMLKTEAIFSGDDINNIYESETEVINKLKEHHELSYSRTLKKNPN